MKADPLLLDHQLCFAVYAASRAMTQAYQPLLAPLGLTYPQYLVMLVLWEGDGLTVGELGQRLQLDSGTLTPLLKRLAVAGLVDRRRDDVDERVVRLTLTAAGRALRRKAVDIPRRLLCQLELTVPELGRLRGQLTELTARLRPSASSKELSP